jgi:hypothetical protein
MLTYFEKTKKSLLEGNFCDVLIQKYEMGKTKAQNQEKYFGLGSHHVPKVHLRFGFFQKKVKITVPY